MRYSVVMPAHRPDEYLIQAVRSVEHAIGADDAELIIVANGAKSESVVQTLSRAGFGEKTSVVTSDIPSIAYCLNKGIELARGEFIARFDSDDICMPDRFRRQYEFSVRNQIDFLFSGAMEIDANGAPNGKERFANLRLWKKCGPIHPAALIRRSALLKLGGYGNFEYSEDYHLWLRAASEGYKLEVDAQPVIYYRTHIEQATDKGKLAETFATNMGIKLIVGIRRKRMSFVFGAIADAAYWTYRKCINVFS